MYPGTAHRMRIRLVSYDPESNADLYVFATQGALNTNSPFRSSTNIGWGYLGRDEVEVHNVLSIVS